MGDLLVDTVYMYIDLLPTTGLIINPLVKSY